MNSQSERLSSPGSDCLAGGGEMGALMRSMDWSKTAIGAVESWSPALRMMVRLLVVNRFQLFLWWGPKFCQLYNDASWPALGTKHPRPMGQPASECWPEIGFADIVIRAAKSESAQPRLISMSSNLAAWLSLYTSRPPNNIRVS